VYRPSPTFAFHCGSNVVIQQIVILVDHRNGFTLHRGRTTRASLPFFPHESENPRKSSSFWFSPPPSDPTCGRSPGEAVPGNQHTGGVFGFHLKSINTPVFHSSCIIQIIIFDNLFSIYINFDNFFRNSENFPSIIFKPCVLKNASSAIPTAASRAFAPFRWRQPIDFFGTGICSFAC